MAEFKTSFIPKRPIVPKEEKRDEGVNIVFFVSLIIFLGIILVTGVLFLYKVFLLRQESVLAGSIERAREAVEPALIANLERIDRRIVSARDVVDDHLILSPLFRMLEDLTIPNVAFQSIQYAVEPDGKILLRLSGESRDYSSLALQSVIFGENPDIQSPVFSNLQLNPKGHVTFHFTANLNKQFVLYKNSALNNVVGF